MFFVSIFLKIRGCFKLNNVAFLNECITFVLQILKRQKYEERWIFIVRHCCFVLVSCSDDDDQGGVIDTGIHKIVVEQSGDIDAFELGLVFGAVNTTSGPTKLYDEDGKYLGESHSVTRMEDAKVSCQTGDDAFFMTCAGSVTSTSDVSGKKLKVLVTAYIDGKEVNQLVKEYETKGEILIENFSVSTTAK